MKYINPKSIIIGVITLAFSAAVALGIGKVWANQTTTTVTGNVVSFVVNPEGRVDGAILDTDDQVKFGAEAGAVVTANLRIGAPLTATGNAGTKSSYGREFHAQTLQIGDRTITIAKPKGPKEGGPKPPKPDKKPAKDGEKPLPPNGAMTDEKPVPPDAETNREAMPKPEAPAAETAKISGNVKFVLVNKDGKPRGLILASGEQLDLGKEVENANLSFDRNTSVSVEGETAKSEFGTFVRPKVLSIGNQTFTFNR